MDMTEGRVVVAKKYYLDKQKALDVASNYLMYDNPNAFVVRIEVEE